MLCDVVEWSITNTQHYMGVFSYNSITYLGPFSLVEATEGCRFIFLTVTVVNMAGRRSPMKGGSVTSSTIMTYVPVIPLSVCI